VRRNALQRFVVRQGTRDSAYCEVVVKVYQEIVRIMDHCVQPLILRPLRIRKRTGLQRLADDLIVETKLPSVHSIDALQTLQDLGRSVTKDLAQFLEAVGPSG